MKRIIVTAVGLFLVSNLFAKWTNGEMEKVKKTDHYIGLQANFLLRELINIGGNNLALQNPYGMVYHLNSRKSGLGFRVGLGPRIYSTTNRDGNATISSNGYNMSGRLGFDKRIKLDDKWESGVGIDILYSIENDKTVSDQLNFNRFKSEIQSENTFYGGGPMGYLRYYLRQNILIGTEASFYFVAGETRSRVKFTDEFGNVASESDDKDKFQNGQLNLPISLYLFVKF